MPLRKLLSRWISASCAVSDQSAARAWTHARHHALNGIWVISWARFSSSVGFLQKNGFASSSPLALCSSSGCISISRQVSTELVEKSLTRLELSCLLHQGFLSILSVWRVSTVCQPPCLCSIGFLNGSDQGSYTVSRYQGQCIIHLHAALQVCFSQSSHCCQGDRIPLDFASVHQCVRNRTDEAHVYFEAESKVSVLCIVSIERRRLAQASQVLEQLCIQRFGSGGHNRSQLP